MSLIYPLRNKNPTRPVALTDRQREALKAFRQYEQTHRVAPTYDALAAEMGVSKSTARDFIRRLIHANCLAASPTRYRGWVLTPRGKRLSKPTK